MVAAKVSNVAYKLDLPAHWKIHPVFHASLLTPYNETPEHGPNFIEPPPDIIEGEERWEVEELRSFRRFGRYKKQQYLAHWKGFSPAHDSWVNIEDLDAPELIDAYWKRQTSRQPRTQIRASSMDFDNPCLASSREVSPSPADLTTLAPGTDDSQYVAKELAQFTDDHGHVAKESDDSMEVAKAATKPDDSRHVVKQLASAPRSLLGSKELSCLNGIMVFAKAAVAYKKATGHFPRKLHHKYFYLTHRLGRIRWRRISAYPTGFTATDIHLLDRLMEDFKKLAYLLQPYIGVEQDKKARTKKTPSPVSAVRARYPSSSVSSGPPPISSADTQPPSTSAPVPVVKEKPLPPVPIESIVSVPVPDVPMTPPVEPRQLLKYKQPKSLTAAAALKPPRPYIAPVSIPIIVDAPDPASTRTPHPMDWSEPDPETPVPAGPPMEWAERLPPDAPPPEFPLRDWEQRLVETYGPSPLSADPMATSKPPSPPETTEDPDALTPEWKAFLALGTPPLAGSSRKREWDTGVFHKDYPTKHESPFASPQSTPTGSSSSTDLSLRPTRQLSPTSVLPQYAKAGPSHSQASREQTPEDPDLRGKQVHWERCGVTTLGTTHQFSSPSPSHAAPELPTTPPRDSARSPDMPGAMTLDASFCVPAQIRIALAQIADAISHKTSTD
jgi:hypothetical protein